MYASQVRNIPGAKHSCDTSVEDSLMTTQMLKGSCLEANLQDLLLLQVYLFKYHGLTPPMSSGVIWVLFGSPPLSKLDAKMGSPSHGPVSWMIQPTGRYRVQGI